MSRKRRARSAHGKPAVTVAKSRTSRGLIIRVIIVASFIAAATLWNLWPERELRRWQGKKYPSSPPGESIARYRKVLETAQRFQIETEPHPTLDDPELLSKLEAAKKSILEAAPPAHAWAWDEVRGVVHEIGSTIPITLPRNTGRGDVSLGFDIGKDRLIVWPRALHGSSLEDITHLLVHEATHGVYKRRLLEALNVSMDAFFALLTLCEDWRIEIAMVTEGLAFHNEARWIHDRAKDKRALMEDSTDATRVGIQLAHANTSGQASDRQEFARFLLEYARRESLELSTANPQIRPMFCGPPIVLRGASGGRYLYPEEFASEILGPVVRVLP